MASGKVNPGAGGGAGYTGTGGATGTTGKPASGAPGTTGKPGPAPTGSGASGTKSTSGTTSGPGTTSPPGGTGTSSGTGTGTSSGTGSGSSSGTGSGSSSGTGSGSSGKTGAAGNSGLNGDRFLIQVPANPATTGSVDRKVDDLFRQVFRGKVPDKPTELIDKLSQVVQARKVEGRATPDFEYSPRSLGTIKSIDGQSVAQTSLFERAHAALTDAERRLAELKPLQAPADPDSLDALRAVTASTYKRLVNELGEGGGPRNRRALRLFDVLIGDQGVVAGNPLPPKIELKPGSLLKQIEDEFKFTGVGTSPEHSANLANFRILKENLFDIYRNWGSFKGEIEGDFSARAARLSRTYELIGDDVNDLEAVLDAVGYDATDRESDPLPKHIESEKITVDGLLSWIREFAAEEGPEMLDEGGAIGVIANIPILEELTTLGAELETHLATVSKESSVSSSVQSLNKRLGEAKELAIKMKP